MNLTKAKPRAFKMLWLAVSIRGVRLRSAKLTPSTILRACQRCAITNGSVNLNIPVQIAYAISVSSFEFVLHRGKRDETTKLQIQARPSLRKATTIVPKERNQDGSEDCVQDKRDAQSSRDHPLRNI